MLLFKDTVNVVFFGRCGVGKTSTINSLFNLNWKVEHGKAATKELTKKVVEIETKGQVCKVLVIDTPGFAESTSVDYTGCHKEAAQMADCIFWLYQADVRYFSADQKALLNIKPLVPERVPFFIGLNHIDLIHPQNWDSKANMPSMEQRKNIPLKSDIVLERLKRYLPPQSVPVIPYSAKRKYNLELILEKIVSLKGEVKNV
jgi:small GTP-binding protein